MSFEPILLYEYTPDEVSQERLPVESAELLKQRYSDKVIVESTSFLPRSNWRLTAQGWVGYIPLTPEIGLRLLPKQGISINNLFRMLEYAYNLKSFYLFKKELFDCNTLEDFYDRLANILARRVLDRGRRGFYHAYTSRSEQLPYVRGRIDLQRASTKPWEVKLECCYEEHTSDIEDNQILAWTLLQILRSGLCTARSSPFVLQAYRKLSSFADPTPCGSEACLERIYNRLNHDYEPMHALCRLFLEHLGPAYKIGNRQMIPFVVNMASLFELFVAEWLKAHPLERYAIEAQKEITVDQRQNMKVRIDLILSDKRSHLPKCVMDTKYKVGVPSMSDIYQVVAYAEANGCRDAILVYPSKLEVPLDFMWGNFRIRSATFSLEDDLELAGQRFVNELIEHYEE